MMQTGLCNRFDCRVCGIALIGLFSLMGISMAKAGPEDTRRGSSEAFALNRLPALVGIGEPSFAWRSSDGLVVEQGGRFFLLAEKSDDWLGIEGAASEISPSAITAAADGTLHIIDERKRSTLSLEEGKIVQSEAVDFPLKFRRGAAVYSRSALYTAGVDADGQTHFLRDSEPLPPWSAEPPERIIMAELRGQIYLFAAEDSSGRLSAYEYTMSTGDWSIVGVSRFPIAATQAFSCGDAHILLVGEGELNAFYTTQRQFVSYDFPEIPSGNFALAHSYKSFDIITPDEAFAIEAVFPGTKYGIIDHLIVASFFLGMLWIGKVLSKRGTSESDFFRGGQRLPWWALGLSLFATGASAISLMAMPAKAYTENWFYMSVGFAQLMMLPFVFLFIIPIARRLQFKSAFQYLEVRFSGSVRVLGNLKYIVLQIFGRFATIMLLPSIAMSAIVGIPMELSIVVMGVITTIYCTMGGFEAVVWTDVIQAMVMLLAMGLCVVWVFMSLDGSAADAWQLIASEEKLKTFNLSWDAAQPIFYIILLSAVFDLFGTLSNQNFVQRVQATATESDSRKATATQLLVALPINFLLFGLGTCLFIYYNQNPNEISPAIKADAIFPLFAAQNLPVGLAGIVVAALMAATMSTLSSALNSVSNVIVEDYIRWYKPTLTGRGALFWGKGLTVFFGILGTGIALWLARSNMASVWDLALVIVGIFFAPMTGVYMLGLLTCRANTVGVWGGMIAGISAAILVQQNFHFHPFFFGPISMGTCVLVGYLVSVLFPSSARDLTGLTIRSLPPKLDND